MVRCELDDRGSRWIRCSLLEFGWIRYWEFGVGCPFSEIQTLKLRRQKTQLAKIIILVI